MNTYLRRILTTVLGAPTEGPCPLCSGTEFYATAGTIRASLLIGKINDVPAWAEAHVAPGNVPELSQALKSVLGDPHLPDVGKHDSASPGDDGHDVRCSQCHSLVPPQFWRVGPARRLALTVAGAPAHGKTTWLLAVLKPPQRSRYSIVGFSEKLVPRHYLYSEPYTLTMLEKGLDATFRSFVPLLLMGSTIRYGNEDVDIRTLDIMGEMFADEDHIPRISGRIKQHITARRGGGALFIVQRFSKNLTERTAATKIASVYTAITGALASGKRMPVLWKGVVWTFLDEAQWSPETDAWLRHHLPEGNLFCTIGETLPTYHGDDAPFAAYRAIRDARNLQLSALVELVEQETFNVSNLSPAVLEGLIALLFRLQVVYSLDAARHGRDRLADYNDQGKEYVGLVQRFARMLYRRWDAEFGGVSDFLTQEEWRVMPCGRLVEDNVSESVWNDQLLLDTLRWVRGI